MIEWLNIRQSAIDDAKRDTPHTNVQIFHYTEVNRVRDAIHNMKRVASSVLPNVTVDYLSYSAYDVQEMNISDIVNALNYLSLQMVPKPSINGKRVFIGEFGIPESHTGNSPTLHEQKNRQILLNFIKGWNPPFILYWQMYNDQVDKVGNQIGYWLINDKNQKQPLYFTLQGIYSAAVLFVNQFYHDVGSYPTPAEYQEWLVSHLKTN